MHASGFRLAEARLQPAKAGACARKSVRVQLPLGAL